MSRNLYHPMASVCPKGARRSILRPGIEFEKRLSIRRRRGTERSSGDVARLQVPGDSATRHGARETGRRPTTRLSSSTWTLFGETPVPADWEDALDVRLCERIFAKLRPTPEPRMSAMQRGWGRRAICKRTRHAGDRDARIDKAMRPGPGRRTEELQWRDCARPGAIFCRRRSALSRQVGHIGAYFDR